MPKTEKKPRTAIELAKLENTANTMGGDYRKTFLLFRYTGMHPSVIGAYDYTTGKDLFEKRNLLDSQDENKRNTVSWNRPKKDGAWAYTEILKHPHIDFSVTDYAKEVHNRASAYKRSRQWFHKIMRELGENAGIPNISPLSFRHTLAVELKRLNVPETDICDILNISRNTLRKYGKRVVEERNDVLAEAWRLNQ